MMLIFRNILLNLLNRKNMNMYTTQLFDTKNIETLTSLVKRFPNNGDLGREVRKLFRFDGLVLTLPNDHQLGAEIRKSVVNFSK